MFGVSEYLGNLQYCIYYYFPVLSIDSVIFIARCCDIVSFSLFKAEAKRFQFQQKMHLVCKLMSVAV